MACQGIEMDRLAREGVPVVPTSVTVAFFVRLQRGMMGWKQETLADFARVSLSTIERIERGEGVSAESLDALRRLYVNRRERLRHHVFLLPARKHGAG